MLEIREAAPFSWPPQPATDAIHRDPEDPLYDRLERCCLTAGVSETTFASLRTEARELDLMSTILRSLGVSRLRRIGAYSAFLPMALVGLACGRDAKVSGELARHLQPVDAVYLRFFEDTARSLLAGYRLPSEADFRNYWKYYNNTVVYGTEGHDRRPKAPFWTDGFFNADDRLDFAYILIHETTGKKSLVVFVSDQSGYRPVLLQEDFDEEMGLATQQPVKLSYYPRADAHSEVLDMKREGIAFFMFESASSVFLWDPATSAFKRYWISD